MTRRTARWVFVLFMACFMGLSGHAHTHAARLALDVQLLAPVVDTVVAATPAEETCAICLWKAQTPFVPPLSAPVDLMPVVDGEQTAVQSRAPPAIAATYCQNRAPPTLLS